MHFGLMGVILFQTVHCATYTIAHQSGPHSTTYTCYVHQSTETRPSQFLTSYNLNSSLFDQFTEF
jgi:hypothetical protein